jgi:antitoxin HigA-1
VNILLEKYKGIHPGIVLKRLLDKKNISQRPFALSIDEHPQTLNAITKSKRNLNTALALKIEKALALEEGTLALLQTYYDIKIEREKTLAKPNLSIFRKSLFWDTDISKINWDKQYKAIIERVYERGNELEKSEIVAFYGLARINKVLQEDKRKKYSIQKTRQKV